MNCNQFQSDCTRKQAAPRKGCPTCEFTINWNQFKKALDQELKKVKCSRTQARQWNGDYLLKLVTETAYQAGLHKKSGRKWTVTTSILVSVYRSEIEKIKAIENFNLMQAAETGPVDEDYD